MLRSVKLACLSGLVLALAFPRMYWWWCAWAGLIPLFIALTQSPKKHAFLIGFAFGIVFWTLIVSWLRYVTVPGTILLILYLSLYPALFAAICSRCDLSSSRALWLMPSVWVLLEYVRSHLLTGFGWALLGYSQAPVPALIQAADIAGAYGISFLIVLVNALVYRLIVHRRNLSSISRSLIIPSILIVSAAVYSAYSLKRQFSAPESARISVLQPNIPQELKWYAPARQFIVDTYARMNQQAQSGSDLIIWPEAAIPGVLGVDTDVEEAFYRLLQGSGAPVLFGAVRRDGGKFYNSALLFQAGELVERYDKMHLVPFGEFIPFRHIFPFLETVAPIGDMIPGKEHSIFTVAGLRLAALICFEDLFPETAADCVKRGAGVLVNITNDAWYLQSGAAEQHFQASVFRAVETRRYLVRSANTGVSGFVDPHGRQLEVVRSASGDRIFGQGIGRCSVRAPARGMTFYTLRGDVFVAVCLIIALGSLCRRSVPCAPPRP